MSDPYPTPNDALERQLADLAAALRHRLRVIADHELRASDPARHLHALQDAGERISTAAAAAQEAGAPPRLRHFLERGSYEKALAWLDERAGKNDSACGGAAHADR